MSELLIAHEAIESFLDALESENAAELLRQRDAAERDYAEGRVIPWDQVKVRNGL